MYCNDIHKRNIWHNWVHFFQEAFCSSYLLQTVFPVYFDLVRSCNKKMSKTEQVKSKFVHMIFICLVFLFSLQDYFYFWPCQTPPNSDGTACALNALFGSLFTLGTFSRSCIEMSFTSSKRIAYKSCLLILSKKIRSVKDRSDMQMRKWLIVSLKKNTMPLNKILHDLFWNDWSQSFIGLKRCNLVVQSWIKNSNWIGIAQMHKKKKIRSEKKWKCKAKFI